MERTESTLQERVGRLEDQVKFLMDYIESREMDAIVLKTVRRSDRKRRKSERSGYDAQDSQLENQP